MKPIQQHKDSRITNISFDNFTGSICIITPKSDDDEEETKDLMLSSPQTNGGSGGDLFKPNHHLALITQPVLGARSRKKEKIDSLTNSRRSSYNESPSLILPINRLKYSHHESSDSGLDFSLSTNSSVQYPQQHVTIHRPLSALNEDSNTDDGFHDQPSRFPVVNLGRNRSMENILHANQNEQQHRSSSFSNEQEKLIKKVNNDTHLDTLTELHQSKNLNKIDFFHPPPSSTTQQHRSLNDLTNQTSVIHKQHKPLRKKTKLNIIIEPSGSVSSSSRLHVNDEQIHSISRITSSSSNQTTSHLIRSENQQMKPKAITPLGHYPNQEQIRAHINRSVIERQHPPYLPIPLRKGVIKQILPFDASPSKVNNLLQRQQKPSTNIFHPNSNIQGSSLGVSTIQNSHVAPSRQTKQTVPGFYNEEIIDDRRDKRNSKEKRRLNEINKWQENTQKEQVRIKMKDIQEPLRTNQRRDNRQDQTEHFLTSTPRRHYEHAHFRHDQLNDTIHIGQNINRRQYPINSAHRSKPTELAIQTKNRPINSNTDFEPEYSPRNTVAPFQSRPRKLIRIPNSQSQTEQNQKPPTGSMNSLLRTTRIQPMNINNSPRENEINRLSRISLKQHDNTQKTTNRFFQTRSPTSWSVISDHQINQQQNNRYQSSSSSSSSPHNELNDDKSSRTYRLNVIDEQQPLDGRHVIPADNAQLPLFIDSSSQTSSRHTYPFTCTTDPNNIDGVTVDNSPRELIPSDNIENLVDQRSSSSSSLDRFSPTNRFPLPLGRVTVSMEGDDISTNYDSDDGWSDDSAELIYADERYTAQKKKIIASSSSTSHLNS